MMNNNKFKNESIGELKLGLSFLKNIINVVFSEKRIQNYIYYDTSALPAQFGADINVFSTEFSVNYNFYKSWNFYNKSLFQFSSNKKIYVISDFTSYSSLYYERNFFNNAMKSSIGMGGNYFSSYYANAFMPATSQFYQQDAVKIGNYPFVDFFINFRIKTARFFIKVEHLNSGISKANYFYVPHLPTPGRTLKVGVDWTLP